MANEFDIFSANSEDYLDVRDMIARVEVLREERDSYLEAAAGDAEAFGRTESGEELTALESVLDDLRGNGGDEQWEDDWYPVTLIRDSYFKESMDEMLEDCGYMAPYADRPSFIKITVDYDALKMDYTSTEIDGVTYWYR